MKILFATESYYPNIDGGAIAQHNLALELGKRGHEISVIAPGYSYKNTIEKEDGTTIFRTKGIKLPLYMNGRYHFSLFPYLSAMNMRSLAVSINVRNFSSELFNAFSMFLRSVMLHTLLCMIPFF